MDAKLLLLASRQTGVWPGAVEACTTLHCSKLVSEPLHDTDAEGRPSGGLNEVTFSAMRPACMFVWVHAGHAFTIQCDMPAGHAYM